MAENKQITININRRIEWLKKRITMDTTQEEYIRFQMQELVVETATQINEKINE